MKKITFLLLSTFVVLAVAGCGRKSKPEAPTDSFYPHVYVITNDAE